MLFIVHKNFSIKFEQFKCQQRILLILILFITNIINIQEKNRMHMKIKHNDEVIIA